jgi:conjugal transfer pilus assembly protein TraW
MVSDMTLLKALPGLAIAVSAAAWAQTQGMPPPASRPASDQQITAGPTYRITESDFLQTIAKQLKEKEKSGQLAQIQKEAVKRAEQSIENPSPLTGLQTTSLARTFYWDPTIVVNQDIRTPDGQTIARAGTRYNPLDSIQMQNNLFFFDAREPAQVAMAEAVNKKTDGKVKLILTAGSYMKVMREKAVRVYFDQEGTLVNKFGITQVPAWIRQEGNRLRIDELKVAP